MTQDSLLKSAFRSFLKASFTVIGFFITLFLFVLMIAVAVSSSEISSKSAEIDQDNKIVILPDAEDIRIDRGNSVPVILQLNIEGIIGVDKLKKQDVANLLIESREGTLKENRVKAVLLNINTPGGTVIDGDSIYRAIKEYKQRYNVPVIAYIDGLCASGGMYVACAADQIYASDASLIGSVGVIMPSSLNFSKLMETVGIGQKTLIAGMGKDELNPLRPWKPSEGESYQHLIDYYYSRFLDIVTSNRPNLDREKLIQVYGAKVYPAPEAELYGYIDGSGFERRDVLRMLLKAAGIPEDEKYQVVALEEVNWFRRMLFNSSSESGVSTGTMKHQIQWNNDLDPSLEGKFLYLYRT